MPFLGVDVYHHGMVDVFDLAESFHETAHIVASLDVEVVEAEGPEVVALCLTAALAQTFEVAVEPAMVLGYAHLVVVDDDDDVGAQFGGGVESFESLAARERAVADDGDDILFAAKDVAAFLQSCSQGDGGGGVANLKVVIHGALQWRGISRDAVHAVHIEETVLAPGEHLVGIALVGDIEDNLVLGSVEDIMQGHRSLGEPEVRSYVTTVMAHTVEHALSYFLSHHAELFYGQRFQVLGTVDVFYIHVLLLFVLFSRCKGTTFFSFAAYPYCGVANPNYGSWRYLQ